MISYQEFLALKEEKLRLESENIKLKQEILNMVETNDEILPKSSYLLEQLRAQNQEKESKIKSLELDIFKLRNQITSKQNIEKKLKEKNNYLTQINQIQNEKSQSLKSLYKQQINEFMLKSKQNSQEITDLKSLLGTMSSQIPQSDYSNLKNENQQLKNSILLLNRKCKAHKSKNKIMITRLSQQNEEIASLKEKINTITEKNRTKQKSNQNESNDQNKKLFVYNQNLIEIKEQKIKTLEKELSDIKQKKIQNDSDNIVENEKMKKQFLEMSQENEILKSKLYVYELKNKEYKEYKEKMQKVKENFIASNEQNKQLLLQCKEKIIELSKENKEKDAKIKTLEKNIKENPNLGSEKNQKVDLLEKQVQELKIANQNLESEKNQRIDLLEKQVQELTMKNHNLGSEKNQKVDLLKKQVRKLRMENQNLESEKNQRIDLLEKQSQELKMENQKLKKSYKRRINKLEQEYEIKIKSFQDQLNEKNDQTNQEIKGNQNVLELEELRKKVQDQESIIKENQDMIKKYNILYNNQENKIKRMETEKINFIKLISLIKQLGNDKADNQQIDELIESCRKQSIELKSVFESINESEQPLKNEIYSILTVLDEKIDELEKKRRNDDEIKERNINQDSQQNQHQPSQVDDLNDTINQMKNELTNAKKNNRKLQNKNMKLKNQIQKNIEENEQKQNIISQLKEDIIGKDSIIDQLNQLNSNLDSENKKEKEKYIIIDNLNHQVTQLNSEIEKIKNENNNYLLIAQQKDETIEQLRIEIQNKENEIEAAPEITDEIKQQIEQHNLVNLNDVNKEYEQNFHTFQMCIKEEPICIAIGDIEGDVEKLRPIYNLIKANPKLNFVFIGDLFDDLSDNHPFASENWECLYLLSEFFVMNNNISFEMDDGNENYNENNSKVYLPSAFQDIVFGEAEFDDIQSHVKFIAGNAECDALSDVKKEYTIIQGDVPYFEFNSDAKDQRWKKTITFEQMCILYQYLKSCYGIISMNTRSPNKSNFIDTVFFRHSPNQMKEYSQIMIQLPNKQKTKNSKDFLFVTGHIRKFALCSSSKPKAPSYVIDTSTNNYKKKKDKQEQIRVRNDKRLAVISLDEEKGFSVRAFSLPYEFSDK